MNKISNENRKVFIDNNVELSKGLMLDAQQWLLCHPQTGFTEWEADEYLSQKFTELGYTLVKAGNIPGFYTDIDTGVPGPTLCIMGELDALDLDGHPYSVNGMAHACGHHGQGSALLGVAAALKVPGATEGLCGKIRLMATPAEELIQLEFREELRQKGIIKYFGGKIELMSRGFFDGVDLSMMVHTVSNKGSKILFSAGCGSNGFIAKTVKYKGVASHAGSEPQAGINAQYAAMLGLQACNDLRETFIDSDSIRFHPIMKGVKTAVNIIPDSIVIESFVRGKSTEAIMRENHKINRALAGGALALGAALEIHDRPGYSPEIHDVEFMKLIEECCKDLAGEERVNFRYSGWGTASSDFGDITAVMPGMQFYVGGASGGCHGVDYVITDPECFCVNAAKALLRAVDVLLADGAAKAKGIIKGYKPRYGSIKEYFEVIDRFILDKEAVKYESDGSITVEYK